MHFWGEQSVSHFLYRLSLAGLRGVLGPIPAGIGRAAGYTLDRLPVCRRADWGEQYYSKYVRQGGNGLYGIYLIAWPVIGSVLLVLLCPYLVYLQFLIPLFLQLKQNLFVARINVLSFFGKKSVKFNKTVFWQN